MSVSVGDQIDGFEVLGQLGEGGLSVVYRVRHLQLGSVHALKVPKIPSDPIVDRLMAEGRVQARLRHPNLVPVTDILDVRGYPGLLMEYVNGPTLREVLDQESLRLTEAKQLGEGLLAGVAFAHAEGVVHRDIKPANVLLQTEPDGTRRARLTDFGMVKLLSTEGGGSNRTRTGMVMGTPAYMAPEQVRDSSRVDARADVFSLGAVLYELLCGRPAFQADNVLGLMVAASKGDFEPPDVLVPELPDQVVLALYTALEVEPALRFADAGEMLAAWTGAEMPTGMREWQGYQGARPASSGRRRRVAESILSAGAATEIQDSPPSRPTAPGRPAPDPAPADPEPPVPLGAEEVLDREELADRDSSEPSKAAPLAAPAPSPVPLAPQSSPGGTGRGWRWGAAALAVLAVGAGAALWSTVPPPGQEAAGLGVLNPEEAPGPDPTALRSTLPVETAHGAAAPGPDPAAPAPAAAATVPVPPASLPEPPASLPEPAAPVPEPAAPVPVPPASVPRTQARAPQPVDPPPPEGPATTPRPAATGPLPAARSAVPEPETAPPEAAPTDPSPEPAPSPEPEPSPPTTSFSVTGDADRVYLVGPSGPQPPGELAPGTYTIRAFFGGDPQPVDQGRITLREGDAHVISCTAGLQMCR